MAADVIHALPMCNSVTSEGEGERALTVARPALHPSHHEDIPTRARLRPSVRPSLAVAEGPPDLRVRDSAESAKGRTETDADGVTSLWQDFLGWVEKE